MFAYALMDKQHDIYLYDIHMSQYLKSSYIISNNSI